MAEWAERSPLSVTREDWGWASVREIGRMSLREIWNDAAVREREGANRDAEDSIHFTER